MRRISLTRRQFAIVDDEDFEWLNQWKWYAQKRKDGFAAARVSSRTDGHKTILMHRVIVDAPLGKLVDHINHETLDNRRFNLRVCTHAQNCYNQISIKGKSQFKGVQWNKRKSRWQAFIKKHYKLYLVGSFQDEQEAAFAYDKAAKEMFGDFAYFNFPEQKAINL